MSCQAPPMLHVFLPCHQSPHLPHMSRTPPSYVTHTSLICHAHLPHMSRTPPSYVTHTLAHHLSHASSYVMSYASHPPYMSYAACLSRMSPVVTPLSYVKHLPCMLHVTCLPHRTYVTCLLCVSYVTHISKNPSNLTHVICHIPKHINNLESIILFVEISEEFDVVISQLMMQIKIQHVSNIHSCTFFRGIP